VTSCSIGPENASVTVWHCYQPSASYATIHSALFASWRVKCILIYVEVTLAVWKLCKSHTLVNRACVSRIDLFRFMLKAWLYVHIINFLLLIIIIIIIIHRSVSVSDLSKLKDFWRSHSVTTTPQPFCGPFSGTTRVSRCQKRTSGLYGGREY